MYDKPNQEVMRKMRWAHRFLDYQYRSKHIDFKDLTLNQYMVGESKIITLTDEVDELRGCLRLMNKISYAMDKTGNWQACRSFYAAVVVAIEMEEEDWTSNFHRFENMLPRKQIYVETGYKGKNEKHNNKQSWKRIPDTVFCRDYQKDQCKFQGSHAVMYKEENIHMEHICAKCYLKNKTKSNHPGGSQACPLNMRDN